MTVYIEYAFLQNFLLDGTLLWLSLFAARVPVGWGRIWLAAAVGGIFALLYPLLALPKWAGVLLKWAVGLLLPLLSFGRIQNKKGWGRYALSATFFFTFTFFFGGALLYGSMDFAVNANKVLIVVPLLAVFVLILVEKIYKRRGIYQNVYACTLFSERKQVKTSGFMDSGNLASKNGRPVCFLTADILYDLLGEELLFGEKARGQGRDEIVIVTMGGEKKLPLYKGEIQIQGKEKKEVYFAPAANRIDREYKVILPSRILED